MVRQLSSLSALAALLTLGACDIYDESLLTTSSPNNAGGEGGGGGTGGSAGTGTGGAGGDTAGTGGSAGTGNPDGSWWRGINDCPVDDFDQSVIACGAEGTGCVSAGMPTDADRGKTDAAGADEPPIILAFSRIRFGAALDDEDLTKNGDAWRDIGFDQDGTCTNSATCREFDAAKPDDRSGDMIADQACQNPYATPPDGNDCRDNVIGSLFTIAATSPILAPLFGITEPHWNCALRGGWFSVLFKISGYNGEDNDATVRLDMYTSTGLAERQPDFICAAEDGYPVANWNQFTTWTNIEPWKVASSSIAENSNTPGDELPDARDFDNKAYVRDGWLFARLPDATEFWLNGENAAVAGMRLELHRAVLIAKLDKDERSHWTLSDGTIAGAVLLPDLLRGFREIGFCENMCESYKLIQTYMVGNQDLLQDPASEVKDCNALSIGIDFDARQATARKQDVTAIKPRVDCPDPKNPAAPPHGYECPGTGGAGGGAGSGGAGSGGAGSGGTGTGGTAGTG